MTHGIIPCMKRSIYSLLASHVGVLVACAILASPPSAQGGCPAIIYVDASVSPNGDGTSWGTAFRYLQDAFDLARQCGQATVEIRVADGTYYPDDADYANVTSDDRTETFTLDFSASLRGSFGRDGALDPDEQSATPTTHLSGEINTANWDDNSASTLVRQYCNIGGESTGSNGNINADPEWTGTGVAVDCGANPAHKDAGNDSLIPDDVYDLDGDNDDDEPLPVDWLGNDRSDTVVDMGAVECVN